MTANAPPPGPSLPTPPPANDLAWLKDKRVLAEMRKEGLDDRWYLAEDGELLPEPMALRPALKRAAKKCGTTTPAILLHADQAQAKSPAFFAVDLRDSVLLAKAHYAAERNRRNTASVGVQLGMLAFVGLVIYFIIATRTTGPAEAKPQIGISERLRRSYAENPNLLAETRSDPALRLVVGQTDYLVVVSNRGYEDWPRLRIEFENNDEELWSFDHTESVRAGQTLTIRKRSILNSAGEAFSEEAKANKVRVTVPGYSVTERSFGNN